MRLAVIADVHANLPALDAVLAAIAAAGADATLCLGDLVGYNAEPAACIARVRAACDVVVAGNHDRDSLAAPQPGTHKLARRVQDWTRGQLDDGDRGYLAGLPPLARHEAYVAAHGSYLSDVFVSGYVTSTMLEKNLLAIEARPGWPPLALCGHTHVPMLGWLTDDHVHESRLGPAETWPARARAVIVNPGSVGQPRDGDPRAAFALIDTAARTAEVRRVPYDVDATCAAIARAGLPPELGERVREGR